jgi:hypothetical protein
VGEGWVREVQVAYFNVTRLLCNLPDITRIHPEELETKDLAAGQPEIRRIRSRSTIGEILRFGSG